MTATHGTVRLITAYFLVTSLTVPNVRCHASTRFVPEDHATIAEALAVSVSGDSVLVASAEQVEALPVRIPGGVSVIGVQGRDVHTLHAPYIMMLSSADEHVSTLEGFTIDHDDEGIPAVTVVDNLHAMVLDNRIESEGGGIRVNGGATIRGNEIYCNISSFIHALIVGAPSSGRVSALDFSWNTVLMSETGINVAAESHLTAVEFSHNTLFTPSPFLVNVGWLCEAAEVLVSHNVVYQGRLRCYDDGSGSITFMYNCFWECWTQPSAPCDTAAPTNFEADPLFCNIASPSTLDLHLNANSPCVDGGEDGSLVGSLGVGCGVVGVEPLDPLGSRLRVYPNPTKGIIRAEFDVPVDVGHVSVAVFDAAGRLLQELASGPRAAGRHEVVWDGRQSHTLTPAVYFIVMEQRGGRTISKIVVR